MGAREGDMRWTKEQVDERLAALAVTDRSAAILLALRKRDPKTVAAHRAAIAADKPGGTHAKS
jgi:hypothetical protein